MYVLISCSIIYIIQKKLFWNLLKEWTRYFSWIVLEPNLKKEEDLNIIFIIEKLFISSLKHYYLLSYLDNLAKQY